VLDEEFDKPVGLVDVKSPVGGDGVTQVSVGDRRGAAAQQELMWLHRFLMGVHRVTAVRIEVRDLGRTSIRKATIDEADDRISAAGVA
jgi:hypothetical protein